jgi:hypothetical protein
VREAVLAVEKENGQEISWKDYDSSGSLQNKIHKHCNLEMAKWVRQFFPFTLNNIIRVWMPYRYTKIGELKVDIPRCTRTVSVQIPRVFFFLIKTNDCIGSRYCDIHKWESTPITWIGSTMTRAENLGLCELRNILTLSVRSCPCSSVS